MTKSSLITELLIQISATIIGGILLAIIFFFVKKKFYRIPTLSGLWTFRAVTEKTSYNPFKEMSLFFLVTLVQEGNQILGTGEKIKEIAHGGTIEYEGKQRTHIQISGFITQRFFSANECVIHITEEGELRNSSTIQNLKIMNESTMNGTFASTIANQIGRVSWNKGNSNDSFSKNL